MPKERQEPQVAEMGRNWVPEAPNSTRPHSPHSNILSKPKPVEEAVPRQDTDQLREEGTEPQDVDECCVEPSVHKCIGLFVGEEIAVKREEKFLTLKLFR